MDDSGGGILIYNKIIKQISGPISFFYLMPNYDILPKKNKYPLLIFFGDSHRSSKYFCNPCNNYDGCYQINSNNFLKLIDSLSNLQSKPNIDFYIETAFYGSGLGFAGGPLEYFTSGNFVECYNRKIKNTPEYKSKCPTENIRWHNVDVRSFGAKDRILNYFNIDILRGFNEMDNSTKSKTYKKENMSFELKLYNTTRYIKTVTDNSKYNDISNDALNDIFSRSEFMDIVSSSSIDGKLNSHSFYTYFVHKIQEEYEGDNTKFSPIWKEYIRQQKNDNGEYVITIEYIIDFYKKKYNDKTKYECNILEDNSLQYLKMINNLISEFMVNFLFDIYIQYLEYLK